MAIDNAGGRGRMVWDFEIPGHPAASLSDIQEFLDSHSFVSEEGHLDRDHDFFNWDEEEGEIPCVNSAEESKRFWDSQNNLLEGILCRSTSTETRIRNSTREVLRQIEAARPLCPCGRTIGDCRCCLMEEVCSRIRGSGYNVGICKSKWRSSSSIPSGEHTFLDVIDSSSSKKGEMRVIIELNFRAEFEMARACEEYSQLLQRLPEVFVGKVERLQGVIKVVCLAAKRCRTEKGMHMGPWRKQRYMQAKWLGSCQRTVPIPAGSSIELAHPPSWPRASMLTMDLLENLPPLAQCTLCDHISSSVGLEMLS